MNYIPVNKKERAEMLESLGYSSLDDLYAGLPEKALLNKELNLPEGRSEIEVLRLMKELAKENTVYDSIFMGGGFYNHYIPACVKAIVSLPGFLTAYTPYQAELSQGILRSIFEYQSAICELTGMDVSNASVYDGSTAAAEAVMMITGKKQKKVLVSSCVDDFTLEVIRTYAFGRNVEIEVIKEEDGKTSLSDFKGKYDENTAGIYLEIPNKYGLIENTEEFVSLTHDNKGKVIMGVDPMTLSLLKTPYESGADVAVGEGQGLGLELAYGGPYFGFMAAKKELTRSLPGRMVGKTVDRYGKEAYVLTLQAREQHIRREKASSSICSNQQLAAMQALVYLNSLGKQGFKKVGKACLSKAHYLADELVRAGCKMKYEGEFFNEFAVELPCDYDVFFKALKDKGILGGLKLDDKSMLVAVTELNTLEEMNKFVQTLKEVK